MSSKEIESFKKIYILSFGYVCVIKWTKKLRDIIFSDQKYGDGKIETKLPQVSIEITKISQAQRARSWSILLYY